MLQVFHINHLAKNLMLQVFHINHLTKTLCYKYFTISMHLSDKNLMLHTALMACFFLTKTLCYIQH